MSPAAVPSGYASDDLLLCIACGSLGPEALIYPHIGTSPACTEPLSLLAPELAAAAGYTGGLVTLDEDTRERLEDQLDVSDAAAAEGDDESEGDEEGEDEPEEDTVTLTPVSTGKGRSLGTANAKTGVIGRNRAERAHRAMKVNLPGRNQGAKLTQPDPVTVSVTVKVSLYTLALWDVARNDPTLSFDGTLEDFLDECPQALFDLMDFDGLYLVKRNRAMIERIEQSTQRVAARVAS